MINGIGTDLIEVERVAEKMEKKQGLENWYFHKRKLNIAKKKPISMNIMRHGLQPKKHFLKR